MQPARDLFTVIIHARTVAGRPITTSRSRYGKWTSANPAQDQQRPFDVVGR